jgi:hypothetical protein
MSAASSLRQVALDRGAVGIGETRCARRVSQVGHGVLQVPAIGQKRVARRATFGGLRLEEGGDPVAVLRGAVGSGAVEQQLQRRAAGDILEPHAQQDQRVADVAGIGLPVAEDERRAQERLAHPVVVEKPAVAWGAGVLGEGGRPRRR